MPINCQHDLRLRKEEGGCHKRYCNGKLRTTQDVILERKEFEVLLTACSEVSKLFPEGVCYIGGIAVYLHAKGTAETSALAEFTHDADLYISMADMGDLRDIEEVTPNRRRSKHQMVKRGFEFDIYTERQASLIVPYDQVLVHSKAFEGIRVASLEHLFVLKLEAFAVRKGSVKGDKDAKDLLRIAAVACGSDEGLRVELVSPYLRDEHKELLSAVEQGPQVMALAQGDAMAAKAIRQQFAAVAKRIMEADAATQSMRKPPSIGVGLLATVGIANQTEGKATKASKRSRKPQTRPGVRQPKSPTPTKG